ncbi:hypothetical protein HaLaN_32329, partial [Haematococcus lacustris]
LRGGLLGAICKADLLAATSCGCVRTVLPPANERDGQPSPYPTTNFSSPPTLFAQPSSQFLITRI